MEQETWIVSSHGFMIPTLATSTSPLGVDAVRMSSLRGYGGHEPRPLHRTGQRHSRAALNEDELRESQGRPKSVGFVGGTHASARSEIVRAEAALDRIAGHAIHRQRVANPDNAANASPEASFSVTPKYRYNTNGRMPFHESKDIQRLDKVWARQETLRMNHRADDAKMYNDVKYERKAAGPFMGMLASRGTIIHIGDEDYVEYRVLTKPLFF
ncbi:hypothetical protein MAA_10066 [Metarhizium robertsii ARSEF 23]|uniref:Uncharacterized protein n=1 Tax=Metarhizium robertsii (strain ARSEF 23 / ATCC MYA-3075) TaxID=655844 RepID=E9FCR7_METRA|nr:uncharacterized protein MAA_10066 [Metarhizium robertsii ARSEF 23]EFY94487.1 hypothetical protein MAA_10066 [Metarhizium robertsii ARSEF 23]